MNKYRAQPTEIDGIRFASKREAKRYQELKLLERAGVIEGLTLQPRYRIEIGGVHVCDYVGDFTYKEDGKFILEDSKGFKTPVYRLKKKLMMAQFGLDIREV